LSQELARKTLQLVVKSSFDIMEQSWELPEPDQLILTIQLKLLMLFITHDHTSLSHAYLGATLVDAKLKTKTWNSTGVLPGKKGVALDAWACGTNTQSSLHGTRNYVKWQ
jgi:hypothetical protein